MPIVLPPPEESLPTVSGYGDGLMIAQPDCGPYDPSCCNGIVCPECYFEANVCRVAWSCPASTTEAKLYKDDVLISSDKSGVIGLPTSGIYKLISKCENLKHERTKVVSGSSGSCGNCCQAINKQNCSAPIVLTLSGLPPYPAWDGWNASFVMDCTSFTDRCYRQLNLLKGEYAPCTGSLATEAPDAGEYHINDYGLFINWDSAAIGGGVLGKVSFVDGGYYSKKESPSSCLRYYGGLGGGGSMGFIVNECKLPITGSVTRPWPVGSYGGSFTTPTFSDFFGPPRTTGETYTFYYSIE